MVLPFLSKHIEALRIALRIALAINEQLDLRSTKPLTHTQVQV